MMRAAIIGVILATVGVAMIAGNAWLAGVAVLLAYVLGRSDEWQRVNEQPRRGGFIGGR